MEVGYGFAWLLSSVRGAGGGERAEPPRGWLEQKRVMGAGRAGGGRGTWRKYIPVALFPPIHGLQQSPCPHPPGPLTGYGRRQSRMKK